VLAGFDGSKEAVVALESALGLFGGHVTSLTIASVMSHESVSTAAGLTERSEAQEGLEKVIESLPASTSVTTKLLYGRPDSALAEFARTAGIELIVVGPKRQGVAHAVVGSVARRLAHGCQTPVFVGPRVIPPREAQSNGA